MTRKLSDKEIKLLNALYDDKELGARGLIRKFIIRNTYEPMYEVGDMVKVTCYGERIWGNPVVEVNARVVEVDYCLMDKGDEHITYELEAYDQNGKDYCLYAEEYINSKNKTGRFIVSKSNTDMNYFAKNSEYSQSCSM